MASDAVLLAQELIRVESVTPDAGGALQVVAERLRALGFAVEIATFDDGGGPPVPNLYARLGSKAPNLCFAGHTDVVPVGERERWGHDPFAAVVEDGALHGRGAADMKSAIAAFVVALERYLGGANERHGSISLLLTGDEEGPGVNGTKRMLERLHARGEKLDYCVVGEPTNPTALGEMIKIGRRGSLHGVLRALGSSGHVAYPQLADNPIPKLIEMLRHLLATPLDEGNAHFQPSNLEVLDLSVGNDADNVIPAVARARFNIRFNNEFTPDSLMAEVRRRCDLAGARYEIDWRLSGDAFLTPPGFLSQCVSDAVFARLGRRPELSTTGGTSDARFLKDFCPVVEVGLVGATMHKVDERVLVSDIEALTDIYQDVLRRILGERMSAIKDAAEWSAWARALAKQDDVMATLLARHGAPEPRPPAGSCFVSLAHAIVFQQLHGAAARTIWGRVEATVGRPFTPQRVLAVSDEALLAAGLSGAKRRSIQDLAQKAASGELKLLGLSRLSDEEVVERLISVRGIGRWTAEMFLLFKLRRKDVWPVTDFGVRKGYMQAYGLPAMPEPTALQPLGDRFAPYRSVAAWYLWRAAEDKGLVTTDLPVAAAKPRKRSAGANSSEAKKARAKQKSRTS